jgi:hypothetical protein
MVPKVTTLCEKSINVPIQMLVASDKIHVLHHTEITLYHVLFDSKCVEVALEL